MATVPVPQFTDSVDLRYFLEPLNAPTHPKNLLARFPEALYTRSPDSHFMRFMYTLLGPAGVGWLKADLLLARLQLEGAGIQLFDLEAFYGDPFSFGRILTETFDDDVSGLLTWGAWKAIRAQDENYRSRAIEFLHGARLGTTPDGMMLAAASGTGQNVDIVENYQYLFDSHSDDPLGLPFYGSSMALGEFIVLPRPAISQTLQQVIHLDQTSVALGNNHYTLTFNGSSVTLDGRTASGVQAALSALPTIGARNVKVTGGPAPNPFIVTFIGQLSNQDLPTLKCQFTDALAGIVQVPVVVTAANVDPSTETVVIADADRHHMQVALDYLRPVNSYPTFSMARSTLRGQPWGTATASTEYGKVIRFVTGTPAVSWPPTDNIHWIAPAVETEAPQLYTNLRQHYVGFHNVASITAYNDQALADPHYNATSATLAKYNSVHVGPFPELRNVMPYFAQYDTDYSLVFSADRVLADYPEPLTVSALNSDGVAFINDTYPADYLNLQGVPTLKYHDDHFWSSQARGSGAEILEIDLGSPQAVNFIALEVSRKPIQVSVSYDTLDRSPQRTFVPVVPIPGFPDQSNVFFDPGQQDPWQYMELYFNDGYGLIFTRFIRLTFTRRPDTSATRFLFNPATAIQTPWTIDARNVRIGRNVAPDLDSTAAPSSSITVPASIANWSAPRITQHTSAEAGQVSLSGSLTTSFDPRHIYIVQNPNIITRADMFGTNLTTITSGGLNLQGVATDGVHIYWSDAGISSISRANKDGSGTTVLLTGFPPLASPEGVAVDGTFIYWCDGGSSHISRANKDGSSPNENWINVTAGHERGVAINANFVYWGGGTDGTIGRATIAGASPNTSFITGGSTTGNGIWGVAVDSNFIYWANYGSGTIGRANLDGTGVNQNFISGASGPTAIVVTSQFIYWTSNGTGFIGSTGSVGRANLDGTGVNQNFITGLGTNLPGLAIG